MVDSGASGHYLNDVIIPELRDKLDSYQVLDEPRKIITAGGGQLEGIAQGLLSDIVVDDKRVRCSLQLSRLIVPGLDRSLFSVMQAARNGVVFIFDMEKPMLEANNFTLPLQELGCDIYSFSLHFIDKSGAPELTMQDGKSHSVALATGVPQPQEPGRRQKAEQKWGELQKYCARQ